MGGGGGGGPPNLELGGTSIAVTPKQTDVVDLEVEGSDSASSLEILEPAQDVADFLYEPPLHLLQQADAN